MLNVINQIDMRSYNTFIVEQKLEEPASEEVNMAVRMLKRGKTPKEDSIISELLKKRRNPLMINLKEINKIWKE